MMGRSLTVAVGLALWCAGWAHATAVSTDDTFNLDFFDGWTPGASFTVTYSSTWSSSDEVGYTEGSFCPDKDWWSCICDPGVKLTVPDQPTPMPFNANDPPPIVITSDGTFNENYINVGPNIAEIVFSTTDFNPAATYTCSSPEENNPLLQFFQFCGFKVVDPPGTPDTLYIEFGDPINTVGITSATPEPSQDVLLAIAVGAVAMVQRIRSRRANG